MHFAVDPWDPDYGTSLGTVTDESDAVVIVDIEKPAEAWAPIVCAPPDASSVPPVVFIDGVRRIDARTWITAGEPPTTEPGIFASYAAGAMRCEPGRAELAAWDVGRVLATPAPDAVDVEIGTCAWRAIAARDASIESLTYAVHDAMTKTEVRVAEAARRGDDALIVVDGPLRDRRHVPDAVGLVKTHLKRYLDDAPARVVEALASGERTPVFLVEGVWSRYSWYVRLPGVDGGGPWAGIVRIEASGDLPAAAVCALAERVSPQLLRFASQPHKEPRAPQNLYPIAGLEKELRRRLGDAAVLYRALRRAAASVPLGTTATPAAAR
jgi:hypothetical protein